MRRLELNSVRSRGKIKGIEEQLESLAEHLAKIPKGVSPTPIFTQMKRLEELKAKTQAELDELIRTSTGFDLPIAFKSYEAFVEAARRLIDDPKAEEAKAKILQKMVHKIDVRKDGSFRLHYYVGRNQIAVNHWALGNQTQPGKEKGQALKGPALKNRQIYSSKTLTNGASEENRTPTP